MKKYLIILFLSLQFGLQQFASDKNKGMLTISIDELRSNKGLVIIKLYNSSCSKFPDSESAFSIKRASIEKNKAQVSFIDLPFEKYAFTVFHDENNNGEMDAELIQIMTEGYAFSNDQKITIGPPSFDKASFIFDKKHLKIKLQLQYDQNEKEID